MGNKDRDDVNVVTAVNVAGGKGASTEATGTQHVDIKQTGGRTTKTTKTTKTTRTTKILRTRQRSNG